MSAKRELPLFPLNTVLFPGGPLALRIFEPRYVDMVGRCLRAGTGFGVVLLAEGQEAGEAIEFAALGTEARVVDFDRLEDGLLGLTCIGQRRIRVVDAWRQPDGLNVGLVEDVEEDVARPVPGDYRHLAELVRQLLPEFGDVYEHVERRFDDAGWVGCRLAEMLPIDLADRQALLEATEPEERLALLAAAIRRDAN